MKLLILDGIGGISLGNDIAREFSRIGVETRHINARKLKFKPFYKVKGELSKAWHRQVLNEEFYYYPKVNHNTLSSIISDFKPDTILVIGFVYRFFDLNQISQLKSQYKFKFLLYDTDTCNLFNHRRELIYFFEKELPLYDHIFSFSKTTAEFINKKPDLSASFFPFGYNKLKHQTVTNTSDILFVGSADLRRIFLLEHLTNFKLKVFGLRWKKNRPLISDTLHNKIEDRPIWGDELLNHFYSSKIILNITRSTFYGVETGINLRIFETLSACRFLLTEHSAEVADLFTPGKEIETYHCVDELKDKVTYYLKHDNTREAIASEGHKKFLSHFSWDKRVLKLLNLMKEI